MTYFVNFRFLEATIFQHGCDWFQSLSEEVVFQFFKTNSSQGLGEVHAICEGFDFNLDLMSGKKYALCFFDFMSELGKSALVLANVNLVLSLEGLHEEFNHTLIKVFFDKMGITSDKNNSFQVFDTTSNTSANEINTRFFHNFL